MLDTRPETLAVLIPAVVADALTYPGARLPCLDRPTPVQLARARLFAVLFETVDAQLRAALYHRAVRVMSSLRGLNLYGSAHSILEAVAARV